MSDLVKEIPGSELKHFITAMKACKPGPTYELEGRYGILSLNFKDIEADKAVITMRRRSGNGIVIAVSKSNLIDCHVMSKISQSFSIPLDESGDLNIKRTQRSNGSIDIIKIELFSSIKEQIVDWSSILKRCYSHTALRQIGNKLMANEGAIITAAHIVSIDTVPPNMYKIDEDRSQVKILGSCAITGLEISASEYKKSIPNLPLLHREAEPQILKSAEEVLQTGVDYTPHRMIKEVPANEVPGSSKLLFDTSVSGFNKSFVNNDVKVYDKYMVLGHRGEFRMPARFVKPFCDYIIMVEASNMKGNGKFTATLAPSSDEKNRVLTSRHHKQTFTKHVGAVGNPEIYQLVVGRHPGSTGNIMITRIMFLQDIVIRIKPNDIIQTYLGTPDTSVGNVPDISDPVLLKSLKYAKHNPTWLAGKGKSAIQSSFMSNSYSGLSWFNKISPILPHVKTNEGRVKFSIQSAGNIKYNSESVFIEECLPEDISVTDLENLKKFNKIFVPSEQVFNLLTEKVEVPIQLSHKPWPYIEGVKVAPIEGDYILAFNRNSEITGRILEAVGDKKLVLAGARGAYSHNVFPVNEYFPYKGLIHLIKNAKAIIDIPAINEYDSGLLRLCMAIGGGTTISSNWKSLEYTDGSIYISSEGKYPTSEQIKKSLEEALQRPSVPETLNDYIKEFNETLNLIFT